MGMLHAAQEVAGQYVHLGNRSRPPGHRNLERFCFDPVADPECHVVDHANIIGVTDRWMIELAERLRFPEKPDPQLVIARKVDPNADAAVEQGIPADEQHPLERGRNQSLQPVARAQPPFGCCEE